MHDDAPLGYRFYVKLQAIDFYYADGLAFGHRLIGYGAPEFAVNADHAFRAAWKRRDNGPLRTDHFFGPGLRFPGTGTQDKAHQQNSEPSERQCYGEGDTEAYATGR
jgi:hypothetical protein